MVTSWDGGGRVAGLLPTIRADPGGRIAHVAAGRPPTPAPYVVIFEPRPSSGAGARPMSDLSRRRRPAPGPSGQPARSSTGRPGSPASKPPSGGGAKASVIVF